MSVPLSKPSSSTPSAYFSRQSSQNTPAYLPKSGSSTTSAYLSKPKYSKTPPQCQIQNYSSGQQNFPIFNFPFSFVQAPPFPSNNSSPKFALSSNTLLSQANLLNSNLQNNQKSWLVYATNQKNYSISHKIKTHNFQLKINDNNHLYKFEYSNGKTAYYYCFSRHIYSVKCPARRIYTNGE